MISSFKLNLLRFLYKRTDVLITSALFILTNLIYVVWEIGLVGVSWTDEWKVRLASIIVDVLLSLPYVAFRKFLLQKITINRYWLKMYLVDTVAIFTIYSILKMFKFYIFSVLDWVSPMGLNIAIISVILMAVCFGRLAGIIIDCSKKYLQKKIKIFLESKIWCALLRFRGGAFFILKLFIQI